MKISVVVPLARGRVFEGKDSVKKQSAKLQIIAVPGENPSVNRNRGIEKADGELISFVNGHTFLADNWSEKVIDFFNENPRIDVVGGPQKTSDAEGIFGRASGYAFESIFGAAHVRARYNYGGKIDDANEKHITSANLICRKKVFKKVKFDPNLYPGEDPKFISDLRRNGFKIAYSPEIIVFNKRRTTTLSLSKQIFYYGLTRPKKEKLSETLKNPLFLVPSLFVIYLAILAPLFILSKLFILPIVFYFLLTVVFSIYESWKRFDFFSVWFLMIIFPTIHISYGVGFIMGLLYRRA